jgi:hypothetical protein
MGPSSAEVDDGVGLRGVEVGDVVVGVTGVGRVGVTVVCPVGVPACAAPVAVCTAVEVDAEPGVVAGPA